MLFVEIIYYIFVINTTTILDKMFFFSLLAQIFFENFNYS